MSYIRFENIVKNFGQNEVLKNINLEIEKGQLVTLLGPSGCGKSTLSRLILGLESPSSGQILLDGKPISATEWGRHCIIVSVEREGITVTPKGDTVLKSGDTLVFMISRRHFASDSKRIQDLIEK